MTPAEAVNNWKLMLPLVAVIAGGGGFGGSALFAQDVVTKDEAEKIIANHKDVVLLKERLTVLQEDVTEIKEDNDAAHGALRANQQAILEELRAIRHNQ